eukprot:CAMPEP_0169318088 /NCGR_PEP_ID=MMETSP1017-20121227/7094_1 /TAXON_ID=342587 /ORGANISM="Karlodinium micrum, Strain CCMP2283" /LENGTH=110 /DNA_ID=CAMNT_0009412329 /DNA_START=546 /DNA_END=875 /DNA_ORIENTATION=-
MSGESATDSSFFSNSSRQSVPRKAPLPAKSIKISLANSCMPSLPEEMTPELLELFAFAFGFGTGEPPLRVVCVSGSGCNGGSLGELVCDEFLSGGNDDPRDRSGWLLTRG